MSNLRSAAEAVALLAAAYPSFNVPKETVKVYVQMLSDIPTGALESAVAELIRTSKFFPTVSDIRTTVASQGDGIDYNKFGTTPSGKLVRVQ